MSKPILQIGVRAIEGGRGQVRALFETGSHFSIIQAAKLPLRTLVHKYAKSEKLRTAAQGGRLQVTGTTVLFLEIGRKVIRHEVLVSPDLRQEMLVGAGTMQEWDITIRNGGGRTHIIVGRDVRDPDVTEVD